MYYIYRNYSGNLDYYIRYSYQTLEELYEDIKETKYVYSIVADVGVLKDFELEIKQKDYEIEFLKKEIELLKKYNDISDKQIEKYNELLINKTLNGTKEEL